MFLEGESSSACVMEQYNIGDIAKIYVYYVNRVMEENARVGTFGMSYP